MTMKITLDNGVNGEWAKPGTDIVDGARLKIVDAGQIVEGKFGEQYVFKVMTEKKQEFNIAFNRTSRNTLGRGFGTETEDWKGKVVKAFVVRQMVGDGLKNVLYLAPEGWTMTDDGEFVSSSGSDEPEVDVPSEDEVEEINPSDIPF